MMRRRNEHRPLPEEVKRVLRDQKFQRLESFTSIRQSYLNKLYSTIHKIEFKTKNARIF